MLLQLFKTAAAETAESLLNLKGSAFPLPIDHAEIRRTLARDGICVVPGFVAGGEVERLRAELQRLLAQDDVRLWKDAAESDTRIYAADRVSEVIRAFLQDPRVEGLGRNYTRSAMEGRLTLAAKLVYRPGNAGSGGGWHRDSPVRRQFKSILYLSDVTLANGPFEYIDGSHRKAAVLRLVSQGWQRHGQARFTDAEADRILRESGLRKRTVLGKAGDIVFVDTKGIHRGAPIETGERYALTNYYWNKRIPAHFEELVQPQ